MLDTLDDLARVLDVSLVELFTARSA